MKSHNLFLINFVIELFPYFTDEIDKTTHFHTILILLLRAEDHALNAIIALATPNGSHFHLQGEVVGWIEFEVKTQARQLLLVIQAAGLVAVQAEIIHRMTMELALWSCSYLCDGFKSVFGDIFQMRAELVFTSIFRWLHYYYYKSKHNLIRVHRDSSTLLCCLLSRSHPLLLSRFFCFASSNWSCSRPPLLPGSIVLFSRGMLIFSLFMCLPLSRRVIEFGPFGNLSNLACTFQVSLGILLFGSMISSIWGCILKIQLHLLELWRFSDFSFGPWLDWTAQHREVSFFILSNFRKEYFPLPTFSSTSYSS